jgi:pimeloyl-ACP methyl ester carboxylesterase
VFRAFAIDAKAKTHTVLRYEHRGHGGSAVPPGPYTLDELVDDAARVIREWGRGPVAWIGLSMGGMVGQGLAILHPELLRAAVLANTTSRYPEAAAATWAARIAAVEQGGMAAVADAVVERYLGPEYRAAHPAETAALKAKLLRCDPAGYVGCCHAIAGVDWLDRSARCGRRRWSSPAARGTRRRRWRGRSPSALPAPSWRSSRRPRTSASPSCRIALRHRGGFSCFAQMPVSS